MGADRESRGSGGPKKRLAFQLCWGDFLITKEVRHGTRIGIFGKRSRDCVS